MISLPVENLSKSLGFYKAIGFTENTQFTSENSAHMVLSDTISVMLLTREIWQSFTTRDIPDAKKSAQMALILSCENKQAVDLFIENGARSGGKADPNPIEEYGDMYGRSLEDPDGNIWEAKWMDMCLAGTELSED